MRTATARPPRASDHTSLARAHSGLLDWRLVVKDTEVSAGFENAVIRTGCEAFDAVTLPRPVGNQVLIRLECGRLGPVPWSPACPAPLALLNDGQMWVAVLDALRPCNLPRAAGPSPPVALSAASSAGAEPWGSRGRRASR